ncbi:PRD domain-containing protein [Anaerorhabdus sp.]|uniref:BglG family transcription antiterminator n=1 Tax=Anaerorhabdus sp. TaxID=1872524 RepID=UPI002B2131DA|nr:PRD domain-containing protein [Anaerorhabdus sp.]MEA4875511.1 PRD domain-containing protein [Anaerorhabdus sp.]
MKISNDALLDILKKNNDWTESSFLSKYFNVSSRTIRNYVNKINSSSTATFILSSYKGYKINGNISLPQEISKNPETFIEREDYIIRKLLNSSIEISIFSLADELYISDSTLENDLKQIKKSLTQFNLAIEKNRNIIKLIGDERNKRKLINSLIIKENKESFISFSNIDTFANQDEIQFLYKEMEKIFSQYNLYVNDYGLNNIILHIVVTIDRIKNNQIIQQDININLVENTKDFEISKHIKDILEDRFSIEIPKSELYYLTLIISSNSNTFDYSFISTKNISNFIENDYIQITKELIKNLEITYSLSAFDEEFLIKFTIHIRNLFQRIKNNSYTRNPLVDKIKNTYPLVYDMAVFVANELLHYTKTIINEDEISFIAFHIGSYLETINLNKNKISCYFIYADYHNMHLPAIEKITKIFEDDLNVVKIISLKDINTLSLHTDLIITTNELSIHSNIPIQQINIFVNDNDITSIRNTIITLKLEKKKVNMQKNLNRFIGEKLFKKNYYAESPSQLIHNLVKECSNLKLCDLTFFDEVMEREKLSSTSFPNGVAIPHSLQNNNYQSFLSIVINEKSIKWSDNDVNMIVLIGTSTEDRALFKDIFDDLIAILYEPKNIHRLYTCNNYSDFIMTISEMIAMNQN